MALDSRMQSWGVVAHCLQDATTIAEGVVLKCVDGDAHHSFDGQILNVLPFYASFDGLYHLLCWYSHPLS